ncbi:TPA: hypothetical protein N0F65_012597 [Lagenidium giganteum]|uniref:Trehalase n=1 Tax=Lagenidium giganteum TaxID=4803 RepID=A0AAV2YQG5_9STRA|nr:TPA: hypothetical protein N0F65_012597 [Lagenidium giganteum]
MTEVFADSKHFVDMPIKRNSSTEFQASKSHSHDHVVELRAFLDDHFDPPGSDLIPITPLDFQAHTLPPMIAAIQDDTLRDWAFSLHQLWKNLGRVPEQSLHSSFLHARALAKAPLKRTQNSYYWDSYWIVQGLLVSHMHHTARGVVNNLLEYVAEFGFVPNGGRVYYLTRSQPPMLTSMVQLVARIEYDASYLAAAVPILDNEYRFWMQRGPSGHTVEIERHDAVTGRTVTHVLNRYVSHADHPRPESYREDVAVATEIFEANKTMYYNDVIAAAESGWDFSSRWLRDPQDMRTMATSCIVPVDLNAILFKVERTLMEFHRYLGHTKRAAFYEDAAVRRARAIDAVLWSDEHQAWKDWNLETSAHSTIVSVSDYTPLWAKVVDRRDTKRLDRIVQSLQDSGLHQVGGIQTTTTFTGQQWDAPNAWPPEQDLIIEGLLEANTAASHELARSLLQTWVRTGLVAWQKTGLMFEKYNATEVGGLGVGGEYFPQFGFGWTNGVILKFLTIHQNLLLN